MSESVVFTDTNVSKEDITSQLFIGAQGPEDGSTPLDLGNDVIVHTVGSEVDGSTVFQVEDKGRTMYLKNLVSTVSLEGWTMPPVIHEAEDMIMNNAVSSAGIVCLLFHCSLKMDANKFYLFDQKNVKDNTDSATGGLYVETRYGNETTFLEYEVNVPSAGAYSISLRYALDSSPSVLSVSAQPNRLLPFVFWL